MPATAGRFQELIQRRYQSVQLTGATGYGRHHRFGTDHHGKRKDQLLYKGEHEIQPQKGYLDRLRKNTVFVCLSACRGHHSRSEESVPPPHVTKRMGALVTPLYREDELHSDTLTQQFVKRCPREGTVLDERLGFPNLKSPEQSDDFSHISP